MGKKTEKLENWIYLVLKITSSCDLIKRNLIIKQFSTYWLIMFLSVLQLFERTQMGEIFISTGIHLGVSSDWFFSVLFFYVSSSF